MKQPTIEKEFGLLLYKYWEHELIETLKIKEPIYEQEFNEILTDEVPYEYGESIQTDNNVFKLGGYTLFVSTSDMVKNCDYNPDFFLKILNPEIQVLRRQFKGHKKGVKTFSVRTSVTQTILRLNIKDNEKEWFLFKL